jgi:hypothetical protein
MSAANHLKGYKVLLTATAFVGLALLSSVSASSEAQQAFGLNANHISGFPGNRQAEMPGGGAFNLAADFVYSGGAFRCLTDIAAGPFSDEGNRQARFPIR